MPKLGTAESVGGENAGQPASLVNMFHYPVEAVCAGCGEMIRCEQAMAIGQWGEWKHLGRMPGDQS